MRAPDDGGLAPVDFRTLAQGQQAARLTSPRDIFGALPGRAAGLGYLRDVQGQVLDAWDRRRTERDLVIKMNTGSGKTIVGLLILRSCLNEGFGPGLYVAPTPYLAEQVQRQATRLGIATVDDPDSARYLGGEAIGVINIHKLVNGRSVFGGPASSRATALPIGSVVVDDAHAALATVESQATIVLSADRGEYGRLREMFRGDLRQQSDSTLLDIEAGVPTAVLRVPFWAWSNRSVEVGRVLHAARDEEGLVFSYPLVADSLGVCAAVFTPHALEIRPPFPPTERISSFASATRRIYLTATLPDDGVLVSHFDADAASVANPITPATAADLGDRLILAPQEVNPRIGDEAVRQAVGRLAETVNVVVLVPSGRAAEKWVNVAARTAAAESIAAAVADLQAGHVGLVVLINKYDGIDLPDDACRVLVIDGLPEAYGGMDRRESAALGDSEAMTARQLQRIEQGMGRGVRSADDYCVVLLLGARMAQLIADPRNRDKLSPATRVQLDLSGQVANQLAGKDLAQLVEVVNQVLGRDANWIATSRSALAGVAYPPGSVEPAVASAREAFNAASNRQFAKAADLMSVAVNQTADQRLKGWRQEQLAVYQQQLDPAQAQRTIAGAVELNPRVTRPMLGIAARRITAAANQASEAAAFLRGSYRDATALIVGVNAIVADLALDPERTSEFESAMEAMAAHLGFAGQRPERDTGNGPDVLWAIGDRGYLVIECKSGATTDTISRRDLEQLGHSQDWFAETYGGEAACTPVLVHQAGAAAANAVPPPGCRIIARDHLSRLRDAFQGFAVALSGGTWTDAVAVGEQLRDRHFIAGEFVASFTAAPRRERAARRP